MSRYQSTDREVWWARAEALLVAVFFILLATEYLIPIGRGELNAAWWTWMRVGAPLLAVMLLETRRRELRLRDDALRRLQSSRF